MYTGIRTQLEAGRISFLQGGSLANSTRKLVEEFSFSAVQFLATDWQLLLKALWPGEENPVQKLRMDAHNGATKTTGRMGYGCELRLNAKVTKIRTGSANSNDANMVKEKPFRSGHEFPAISAVQSSH